MLPLSSLKSSIQALKYCTVTELSLSCSSTAISMFVVIYSQAIFMRASQFPVDNNRFSHHFLKEPAHSIWNFMSQLSMEFIILWASVWYLHLLRACIAADSGQLISFGLHNPWLVSKRLCQSQYSFHQLIIFWALLQFSFLCFGFQEILH